MLNKWAFLLATKLELQLIIRNPKIMEFNNNNCTNNHYINNNKQHLIQKQGQINNNKWTHFLMISNHRGSKSNNNINEI